MVSGSIGASMSSDSSSTALSKSLGMVISGTPVRSSQISRYSPLVVFE